MSNEYTRAAKTHTTLWLTVGKAHRPLIVMKAELCDADPLNSACGRLGSLLSGVTTWMAQLEPMKTMISTVSVNNVPDEVRSVAVTV